MGDVGRSSQRPSAEGILATLRKECATPDELLRLLVDDMVSAMRAGLHAEGDAASCLKMLRSHVKRLPTGEEEGTFYALDLGGTNFRVLRVLLHGKGDHAIQQESKQFPIPKELMVATSDKLFDFIAENLVEFIASEEKNLDLPLGKQRELGFTFSFPVKQHSTSSGVLIKWTKGFSIDDMVGKDVTIELSKALKRKNLDMHVAALVNDTVGTLAAGRYHDNNVVLAVILGTGTNAAYVEIEDSVRESGGMVINMEWGNFYSSHLPVTEYDKALDKESLHPGEQIFEKLISGMFLGDLVRRVLLKMAVEAEFFGELGHSEPDVPGFLKKLHDSSTLWTVDINAIHHDTTSDLCIVESILKERFEISHTSLETRKVVVEICDCIAKRAARLAAAGIVGVLKKLGRDSAGSREQKTVIAIDGALYEHYTIFSACLKSTLEELLGEETWKMIELKLTKDGSGTGAALLAASHSQYR